MKNCIFISLLCVLPFIAHGQWSGTAANQIPSGNTVVSAVDSGFLYKIRQIYTDGRCWNLDSVLYYIAIDQNIPADSGVSSNQLLKKSLYITQAAYCSDSIQINNGSTVNLLFPSASGDYLVVCDTNYLGGTAPGTIDFYYGGNYIGGFSGPSNNDTGVLLNLTYNANVGSVVTATLTPANIKLYGPATYRMFNLCQDTTTTITFTAAPSTFVVNYSSTTSGQLTISGLNASGWTNNTCTSSSGQNATQSGTYIEPPIESGSKNIQCTNCLTAPTTTYYEWGPTVTINGFSYSNGSTFKYNGKTYTVDLSGACLSL